MGIRYYYRDPLAAAWMAKYFGMQFLYPDGYCISDMAKWVYIPTNNEEVGFLEIHPDSLHLLKPQIGDIGIDQFGFSVCWGENNWKPSPHVFPAMRINHRNGIPFHWPEVANV